MAVFTNGLSATARAIARARRRVSHPSTSMVMECVAPSPSSAIIRASDSQAERTMPAKAVRSSPRSTVSVAAVLESRSTVSLVLVWPSTETQLKVFSTASERISQVAGPDRGVGEQESQHRGHPRADHRRPFRHAQERVRLSPAIVERDHLRASVRGQDGLRGGLEAFPTPESCA